jgi:hypothetical protein
LCFPEKKTKIILAGQGAWRTVASRLHLSAHGPDGGGARLDLSGDLPIGFLGRRLDQLGDLPDQLCEGPRTAEELAQLTMHRRCTD